MVCDRCRKDDRETSALRRLAAAVLVEWRARDRWLEARSRLRDVGTPAAQYLLSRHHIRVIRAESLVKRALAAVLRERGVPLPVRLEISEKIADGLYTVNEMRRLAGVGNVE